MNDKPAILGGRAVLDEPTPMVRPVLPPYDTLEAELREILATGQLTKGRRLRSLEERAAEYLGVKHAVGVSSCTTGLMLTYIGLGLTGDVIVPSFTFMATVSSIVVCALRPVFADVDPDTSNVRPEAVEAVITPETSAIVGVHNFGNPADQAGLDDVAAKYGVKLIYDAAQAFGSTYRGAPTGRNGAAQVFSLTPTKLVVAGEGGLVATNDDELAERVRIGREYGHSVDYDSAFAGLNGRLPEINALLGLKSLDMLEDALTERNAVARTYRRELGSLPGISLRRVEEGNRCCYKDFPISIDPARFGLTRDETYEALQAEGIDTRKYYDPPAHRQSAYRHFHNGSDLKVTEALSATSLSLPVWSRMDETVVLGVCRTMERLHQNADEVRTALSR